MTPHGLQDHFDDEPTDETRAWVAQVMNSETFLCKIGDFLEDYGPVKVPDEDVQKCKEFLVGTGYLNHSQEKYVFSDYTTPPSGLAGEEADVFENVAPIIQAIFDYVDSLSKRGNKFTVKLVPANHLTASIAGTNHKMDACIIEDKNYTGVLTNNNIVIGKEFKKNRNWRDQIVVSHPCCYSFPSPPNILQVREQIVGDSHHILNDDPRRMFIYGVCCFNFHYSYIVWM